MPRGRRSGGLDLSTTRSQEGPMPLITVRLIEKVFSAEQKQQTARDLTEAMVAIEGERHARRHVLCHR
jgi:hypothetical protein